MEGTGCHIGCGHHAFMSDLFDPAALRAHQGSSSKNGVSDRVYRANHGVCHGAPAAGLKPKRVPVLKRKARIIKVGGQASASADGVIGELALLRLARIGLELPT